MSDSVGSIQRVMAGAEWLDSVYPEWVDRVDLEVLDVGSSDVCVLSQVFEMDDCMDVRGRHVCDGYSLIWHMVDWGWKRGSGRSPGWMNDHGFLDDHDTETWKMYIGARQAVREQLQKPYKELCLI